MTYNLHNVYYQTGRDDFHRRFCKPSSFLASTWFKSKIGSLMAKYECKNEQEVFQRIHRHRITTEIAEVVELYKAWIDIRKSQGTDRFGRPMRMYTTGDNPSGEEGLTPNTEGVPKFSLNIAAPQKQNSSEIATKTEEILQTKLPSTSSSKPSRDAFLVFEIAGINSPYFDDIFAAAFILVSPNGEELASELFCTEFDYFKEMPFFEAVRVSQAMQKLPPSNCKNHQEIKEQIRKFVASYPNKDILVADAWRLKILHDCFRKGEEGGELDPPLFIVDLHTALYLSGKDIEYDHLFQRTLGDPLAGAREVKEAWLEVLSDIDAMRSRYSNLNCACDTPPLNGSTPTEQQLFLLS